MFIDSNVAYKLLENKSELCGFLDENGTIKVDTFGTFENGRGTCLHSHREPYMWHTHPFGLKAYPSAEDILSILKKHDNPIVSLIFTSWGIWEMTAVNKLVLDETWKVYLSSIAKDAFNALYQITDKGKGDLNLITLAYLQTTLFELMYNINRKYPFGFQISFIPWNRIKDRYRVNSV